MSRSPSNRIEPRAVAALVATTAALVPVARLWPMVLVPVGAVALLLALRGFALVAGASAAGRDPEGEADRRRK